MIGHVPKCILIVVSHLWPSLLGQDMVPPVQQLHKLLRVHSTSHAGLTAEDINLAADKLGTQQQLNVVVSDSIKWALMGLSLISRSSVVLITFSLQTGALGSCNCQLF